MEDWILLLQYGIMTLSSANTLVFKNKAIWIDLTKKPKREVIWKTGSQRDAEKNRKY
jgi:hypothetical protein